MSYCISLFSTSFDRLYWVGDGFNLHDTKEPQPGDFIDEEYMALKKLGVVRKYFSQRNVEYSQFTLWRLKDDGQRIPIIETPGEH